MSSKIIDDWNTINKAIETKDIDTFVKLVKENEGWIKYLRYGKMISTEDRISLLIHTKNTRISTKKEPQRF